MERHGDQVEVSTEEASGGEKRNEMRYILAISLALIVLLMAVIFGAGVLSSDAPDEADQIGNPTQTQKSG